MEQIEIAQGSRKVIATRNGGESRPIHFQGAQADANAALIVRAGDKRDVCDKCCKTRCAALREGGGG